MNYKEIEEQNYQYELYGIYWDGEDSRTHYICDQDEHGWFFRREDGEDSLTSDAIDWLVFTGVYAQKTPCPCFGACAESILNNNKYYCAVVKRILD